MAASSKYKCTQTHSKFIWYVLLTYSKYIFPTLFQLFYLSILFLFFLFNMNKNIHQNSSISTWPVCTRHKQDFIPLSIDSRCLLQIGDESPDICICSLSSPPYIYVSKCMYVYVHISLFLPECVFTTIIDISPRIFSLMYCCCVSIIIVICICPPGALIWLINLFLFLYENGK